MKNTDRWKRLFARQGDLSSWENWVRRVDEKTRSFLEFEPAKTLGTTAAPENTKRGALASEARDPRLDDTADEGALRGVPFAVKDNIAVRPFRLTCGSRLLSSFVSPYTATAVARLQRAGAVPVGKTNLDEFGMGSSTQSSAFFQTANPWDLTRVPGGSSGGSAAAVAAGLVPFALGSDTGGSVRQPAAFCGVYGFKPTYGTVSRYGLVAYASSLEQIGVIAKEVAWIRTVFSTIRALDPRDHSTVKYRPPQRKAGPLTVGILKLGGAGGRAGAGAGRGAGGVSASGAGSSPGAAAARLSPEVEAGWDKALESAAGVGLPPHRGGSPDPGLRGQRLLRDRLCRGQCQPGPLRRHAVRATGPGG